MSRKPSVALAVLVLLLFTSLTGGLQNVKLVAADSGVTVAGTTANPDIYCNLTTVSPNNTIAFNDTMPLNFQLDFLANGPIPWMYVGVSYSIDDNPLVTLAKAGDYDFWSSSSVVTVYANGAVDISNLTSGQHKLTVNIQGGYNFDDDFICSLNYSFTPSNFFVNYIPPNIRILSPQNERYNASSASLSFTVDEPATWIGYSLDSQSNVTIPGNFTLTD